VIAPSFADIFYNNCFKNGILPARLRSDEVDYLFKNEDLEIEIDLAKQLVMAGGREMYFELDDFRKKLLFEGLDSIGLTMQFDDRIANYERQRQMFAPSS
jgi:3-isopropylmalate/(R)-2-methylmalate dehydratase small subunit